MYHRKNLLCDYTVLFMGSCNWSVHSFAECKENNILTRAEDVILTHRQAFEEEWAEALPLPQRSWDVLLRNSKTDLPMPGRPRALTKSECAGSSSFALKDAVSPDQEGTVSNYGSRPRVGKPIAIAGEQDESTHKCTIAFQRQAND